MLNFKNGKEISPKLAKELGAATKKEGLTLVSGGNLIKTKWNFDKAKNTGKYVFLEINKNFTNYLLEPLQLGKDIRLKDFLLFTQKNLSVLEPVLGNWCAEYTKAGLINIKPWTGTYDPNGIEFLEVYRIYEIETNNGKDELIGTGRADFHGIGYALQAANNPYKKGDRIPWGVSGTDINELSDIPIKLNSNIEVVKDNIVVANYLNTEYKLLDILHAVFWEMSFYGEPKNKTTEIKKLKTNL